MTLPLITGGCVQVAQQNDDEVVGVVQIGGPQPPLFAFQCPTIATSGQGGPGRPVTGALHSDRPCPLRQSQPAISSPRWQQAPRHAVAKDTAVSRGRAVQPRLVPSMSRRSV
jgi:hypothetical protein